MTATWARRTFSRRSRRPPWRGRSRCCSSISPRRPASPGSPPTCSGRSPASGAWSVSLRRAWPRPSTAARRSSSRGCNRFLGGYVWARSLDAFEPALAPERVDGARAEPAAQAEVAGAHHAFERDGLVLQLDHAAVAIVDEAAQARAHAERPTAVGQHLAVEPEAPVAALRVQGSGDLLLRLDADQLARPQVEGLEDDALLRGARHVNLRDETHLAHRLLDGGPGGHAQEAPEGDVARGVLAHVRAQVPELEVLGAFRQIGRLAPVTLLRVAVHRHGRSRVPGGSLDEGSQLVGPEGRALRVVGRNLAQPGLLPEKAALGLAAGVPGAVAAQVLEQHRIVEPPAARVMDRVADLLGAPFHGEAAAAVGRHLRHEGEIAQGTTFVQGGEDLGGTVYFDQVAMAQRL